MSILLLMNLSSAPPHASQNPSRLEVAAQRACRTTGRYRQNFAEHPRPTRARPYPRIPIANRASTATAGPTTPGYGRTPGRSLGHSNFAGTSDSRPLYSRPRAGLGRKVWRSRKPEAVHPSAASKRGAGATDNRRNSRGDKSALRGSDAHRAAAKTISRHDTRQPAYHAGPRGLSALCARNRQRAMVTCPPPAVPA